MQRIIEWIRKHKMASFSGFVVVFFILPLVTVHFLFKWKPGIEWIAAEWSAGDAISFIAGFEALLGTVGLGLVTIYQSQKANEANERLAKENNVLQKISIQKLLPLVKVTSVEVQDSFPVRYEFEPEKSGMVYVTDSVTSDSRETHINTYLPLLGKQENRYQKVVKLSMQNISDSPIRQISVDRIAFSGFKYKEEYMPPSSSTGMEKYRYISSLLLPGESLDITIDVFFDNEMHRNFWEYAEMTSVGNFDICLYITNTSISDIKYREKIYIDKGVNLAAKVLYKAYEDESSSAEL